MSVNQYIDNRQKSSFFVSVGTGLMLEALFEPKSERVDDERVVEHINIDSYTIHWYNIKTLIRNAVTSVGNAATVDAMMRQRNAVSAMAEAIEDECFLISELYQGHKCDPVFYTPDYSAVYKALPNSIMPGMYPPKREKLEKFVDDITAKVIAKDSVSVHKLKSHKIPSTFEKQLITTHVVYDMLASIRSPNLHLLESHTGKLRTSHDMNVRYSKSAGIENKVFPWNEKIMNILGDGYIVRGLSHQVKLALYRIAIENKWTAYTSDMKVDFGIKKLVSEYPDYAYLLTLKRLF